MTIRRAPNLVARLKGRRPGPILGLLSHVDTVVADPDGWRHGPWSGELDDGCVWGRGALDMKSPWNQIATDLGETVTFFVGTDAIANADIDAFAMVAISLRHHPDGIGWHLERGQRRPHRSRLRVVDSVNAGGGLLGFSRTGPHQAYAYMGDFGTFTSQGDYSGITPTPEGEAIGVTERVRWRLLLARQLHG